MNILGNVLAERIEEPSSWREYIWLPEAEIAPTYQSQAQVDRPLAVVDQAFAGAPVMYLVHVDHLHRPIRMTDAAKVTVWDATWLPWGGAHAITGSAGLNARFPGQWFQLEAGLHYNWHRHYDPTLGRYTQPDPLGFVDGPGVFGYARSSPLQLVDGDGQFVRPMPLPVPTPRTMPRPRLDPNPGIPNQEWCRLQEDAGQWCIYRCADGLTFATRKSGDVCKPFSPRPNFPGRSANLCLPTR